MDVDKVSLLDAFCKLDNNKSGVLSKVHLRKILEQGGLPTKYIEEIFAQGGWVGDSLPYDELVDWLCGLEQRRSPGVDMKPEKLSEVPADEQRQVVIQTLVLLIAAASWSTLGAQNGQIRVTESPSTPDAYLGFCITSASQGTASDTVAMADKLTKQVKELIASASIELEVLPRQEAVKLLKAGGFPDCAALASSVASGCESVGLHAIDIKGPSGTLRFRTPAVANVTFPTDLQSVPWQLRADATAGQFCLAGPTLDLSSLAPGDFGRLGPSRSLDSGVAECNEAASVDGQTKVALQAEAIHENSLAEISARIAEAAQKSACVVVVAGPSSSGKTTFSSRLALHIQARGVGAHPLECDMYYKARLDPTHPRDAKGELNFEVPDALRLDKIKQDLADLTSGKPVELPKFCFKTGTINEKTGNILQISSKAVLIIEGIFGLHPKFLSAFQGVSLFKVLIGPWSGARLGGLHVVPERKLRLLRRIGRDVRSRGVDAARVMHKYTSVSAGEIASIFPYAGDADVIFDSALHYELPALRAVIGKDVEAASSSDATVLSRKKELVNYLSWVQPWSTGSYALLPTSIACEFLGNSIFE